MPHKKKSEESKDLKWKKGKKNPEKPERFSLETELSEEDKKSAKPERNPEIPDDSLDEDDFNFRGAEFEQELRRVLVGLEEKSPLENLIPSGSQLEGAVIFAPRVSEGKTEVKGKDYKSNNYNPEYAENNYGKKTPGYTSRGDGNSSEGSEGGRGNGNQ